MALSQRAGWQPADLARAFMDGGARCIQIRAKDLASDRFLELCDRLVGVADPYGAVVIVNDRPDLAVMANAAGVHVGQDDLPPMRYVLIVFTLNPRSFAMAVGVFPEAIWRKTRNSRSDSRSCGGVCTSTARYDAIFSASDGVRGQRSEIS